jgi:very-short-patch-repair endonuclease
LKIIIELDGEQHFRQVGKWKSPEETQKRDLYKEKCATENSYHVIRLLQEDVWRDKYDWKNTLIETIATITLTKPQIIRICKNDEYNNHTTTTTTTHPQP